MCLRWKQFFSVIQKMITPIGFDLKSLIRRSHQIFYGLDTVLASLQHNPPLFS
jgi:hypothetical protein